MSKAEQYLNKQITNLLEEAVNEAKDSLIQKVSELILPLPEWLKKHHPTEKDSVDNMQQTMNDNAVMKEEADKNIQYFSVFSQPIDKQESECSERDDVKNTKERRRGETALNSYEIESKINKGFVDKILKVLEGQSFEKCKQILHVVDRRVDEYSILSLK